jgi:SPP1 family predicted phage head-tail adaptor
MISDLKHRIALQESVLTADGGGGFTGTWQNIAAVPDIYAEIMPLSGGEQLRFHQLETTVTHRITIRYRDDVSPALRILKGTTVYNIVSVTDRGGLETWLDILATVTMPA